MQTAFLRGSAFSDARCGKPQASVVSTCKPSRQALVVENRVALRFQRLGRQHLPFYRLVAIDSRKRREGKPLEYLGWYDPLKKETNLNAPAIKKWLSTGALPSQTVENLLKRAYVIEPDVKVPAVDGKKPAVESKKS